MTEKTATESSNLEVCQYCKLPLEGHEHTTGLECLDAMEADRDRLREALRIIAEGTLCPDLFPALDLEKDVWELQAKTAMTSAIAALERSTAAPESRDG